MKDIRIKVYVLYTIDDKETFQGVFASMEDVYKYLDKIKYNNYMVRECVVNHPNE